MYLWVRACCECGCSFLATARGSPSAPRCPAPRSPLLAPLPQAASAQYRPLTAREQEAQACRTCPALCCLPPLFAGQEADVVLQGHRSEPEGSAGGAGPGAAQPKLSAEQGSDTRRGPWPVFWKAGGGRTRRRCLHAVHAAGLSAIPRLIARPPLRCLAHSWQPAR